ncbi:MAG: 3-dehydroquinate synthase [Candidatus Methanomethyliaceae archaeon]|nr:3-dehydroquinate synthase [Candidatus Methanomethyliaceae archaeon]MDW7970568.1 3-dehydroquinate synthase [Nitrososphaerota archaeon]
MQEIKLEFGNKNSKIFIGRGLINNISKYIEDANSVVIITSHPIRELYGKIVESSLSEGKINYITLEVQDGEGAKSIESYLNVINKLLAHKVGRDSIIISLGGGCVGDLAGFIAATYMRGLELIHIPTTLLAQVDSSIGGKVAINHPIVKNLIGTFYQPKLVIIDLNVLKTLPMKEIRNGFAEIIKYGAILDKELFNILEKEKNKILQDEIIEKIVSSAVKIKVNIVSKDEYDKGIRMLLNFGHTIGHALEAVTNYSQYSHGEAISLGMLVEGKISNKLGLLNHEELIRLERLISEYELPIRIHEDLTEKILETIYYDKKVKSNKLRFAIPKRIGEGMIISDPPREIIISSLKEVINYV